MIRRPKELCASHVVDVQAREIPGTEQHVHNGLLIFGSVYCCVPPGHFLFALPPRTAVDRWTDCHFRCVVFVILVQRAKLFKAGVGRDEARRGRSETQVQIRKEKKEERLNQRRRKGSAGDALGGFSFATIPEGGAPVAETNAAAVDTPAHMRVR